MARVLENISKRILRDSGIATPDFAVALNEKEAVQIAGRIGYPVVIKALVTAGKRGKAGAVKFARNAQEAEVAARQVLSLSVGSFPVERLLVEKKLEATQELYLSITFDGSSQMPVVVASTAGGVDIEEIARKSPDRLLKRHVNPIEGLHSYQANEIWSDLGVTGRLLGQAAGVLAKLYKVFQDYDATIVEVNPLAALPDSTLVALGVLMGVDDAALYRQPWLSKEVEAGSDRSWRPLTALEKAMIAVDRADPYRGTASFTEMDGGDIGFLCGGGGGSLVVFDTLLRLGARPANYSECGGNPSETKVYGLAKGIISKPGVRGVIVDMNITNNTRTDEFASGFVRAVRELNIDVKEFPIVVRLAGVNDSEARRVFGEAGIEYHGDDITMEEAAGLIVSKMAHRP